MLLRILYGIGISVTVALLLLLDHILQTHYFFSAMVVLFTVLAWLEFCKIALPGKALWHTMGAVSIVATHAAVWHSANTGSGDYSLRTAVVLGSVILFCSWNVIRWDAKRPSFGDFGLWITGLLYAGYLPSHFLNIRLFEHGEALVLLLIVSVKAGDSAAYLFGTYLGKTPLCKVSPNKTLEGAFSALVCTVLTALIGVHFLLPESYFRLDQVILAALLISCIAQAGDLTESFAKRSAGRKHSASLIPQLGGVLDMVDSLFFTAPVLYLLLLWHMK